MANVLIFPVKFDPIDRIINLSPTPLLQGEGLFSFPILGRGRG
jgi:hypothetical protein